MWIVCDKIFSMTTENWDGILRVTDCFSVKAIWLNSRQGTFSIRGFAFVKFPRKLIILIRLILGYVYVPYYDTWCLLKIKVHPYVPKEA